MVIVLVNQSRYFIIEKTIIFGRHNVLSRNVHIGTHQPSGQKFIAMPKKTDLQALINRKEQAKQAKQIQIEGNDVSVLPPVPIGLPNNAKIIRKRKKCKKSVSFVDEDFYSDTDDVATLELRMAFREADRLKRQVAFWKAKCTQLAPHRMDEFEREETEMDYEDEGESDTEKEEGLQHKKQQSRVQRMEGTKKQMAPSTFVLAPPLLNLFNMQTQ